MQFWRVKVVYVKVVYVRCLAYSLLKKKILFTKLFFTLAMLLFLLCICTHLTYTFRQLTLLCDYILPIPELDCKLLEGRNMSYSLCSCMQPKPWHHGDAPITLRLNWILLNSNVFVVCITHLVMKDYLSYFSNVNYTLVI